MNAHDRQKRLQWAEAARWLAKARDDLTGARLLLSGDLLELAAFHIQQGIEKGLKALLVAAAEDIRRTHDIDALAAIARRSWPQLISEPFTLHFASQWYISSRYPGIDEVSLSESELLNAMIAAENLIADIERLVPPDLFSTVPD
jgi:HEPN domain-containing protein